LREIILKVRNLEERGRDRAHIYHAYLSLVAIVCICCVPLSSSLPHPILILIPLALIRSLDDAYVGIQLGVILYLLVFFLACAASKAIDIKSSFNLQGSVVDQFFPWKNEEKKKHI
jgi:hypothetical protein